MTLGPPLRSAARVAAFGVLAAAAILATRSILHRRELTRQNTARADIITIFGAFEAFARDHNSYPTGTPPPQGCRGYDDAFHIPPYAWPVTEPLSSVRELLSPTYVRVLPVSDPWGNPYRFRVTPDGCSYTIVCSGRDGRIDSPPLHTWDRNDVDRDYVFSDGHYVSLWEGMAGR